MILLVPELEALLREAGTVPRRLRQLTGSGSGGMLNPATAQAQLLTGRALAAAPLTRRLDCPDDCQGTWMRADPLGLTPDLSAVWLSDSGRLPPDGAAAAALVEMFASEGMRLDLVDASRAYLKLESVPDCEFTPPWRLAGESMERLFPHGLEQKKWRRLLNETQVILHQHRRQPGQETLAGSLWFWGAGSLPDPDEIEPRVRCVCASDPILKALADWLSLECRDAGEDHAWSPGTLIEWQADHAASAEANLQVLEAELKRLWRRLRLDRKLGCLELASLEQVRTFTTLGAWRMWP